MKLIEKIFSKLNEHIAGYILSLLWIAFCICADIKVWFYQSGLVSVKIEKTAFLIFLMVCVPAIIMWLTNRWWMLYSEDEDKEDRKEN